MVAARGVIRSMASSGRAAGKACWIRLVAGDQQNVRRRAVDLDDDVGEAPSDGAPLVVFRSCLIEGDGGGGVPARRLDVWEYALGARLAESFSVLGAGDARGRTAGLLQEFLVSEPEVALPVPAAGPAGLTHFPAMSLSATVPYLPRLK